MDRETKIRWVILLSAAAITAVVILGLYTVQPLQFYQVEVGESSGDVSVSESEPVSQEAPAGTIIPVISDSSVLDEESTPEGPQEVLVEKSIDINSASLEELDLLPGVGPAIAQRIIDYREANNGFYDIQELMDVSGIGEKTFAKLEPYIIAE